MAGGFLALTKLFMATLMSTSSSFLPSCVDRR